MWWYGHGWGWGMAIAMVVFWVLVIGAIVYAISTAGRSGRGWGGTRQESALDILDRRYARGEITREQYQQMRQDLLHGGGGSTAPST